MNARPRTSELNPREWTKTWLGRCAAASLLLFANGGQARAELVLDQSNTPVNTGEAVVTQSPFPFDEAQTFTVGVTGTLARLDLLVRESLTSTGSLRVEIRATSGGIPAVSDSGILASVTVPHGTVPTAPLTTTYTSIDLSPLGLSVADGEVLAIVLRADAGGSYLWKNGAPVYARGDPFFRQPNAAPDWRSWSAAGENFDFAFQTFVDVGAAVPEPPALVSAVLGALGVWGYAWRCRRGAPNPALRWSAPRA